MKLKVKRINGIGFRRRLDLIDREAKKEAKDGQKKAWDVYQGTIVSLKDKALPAVEK
jgi:hypothetical protein